MATFRGGAAHSAQPNVLFVMSVCNFGRFSFEDRTLVVTASVPGHCLPFSSDTEELL